MIVIYNIVQIAALLLLGPILVLIVCLTPKYKGRVLARLGFGLTCRLLPSENPRIWIHALSVGETASARPLVERIRSEIPDAQIVFSSTTRGGVELSKQMAELVDLYVPFPLDFLLSVRKFIRIIKPDLFVLVETDFWPNFLWQLQKEKVPSILVNGRITQQSFKRYQQLSFLFAPMFTTFDLISMQMEEDAKRIACLDVDPDKVVRCGNLKYDLANCTGHKKRSADFNDMLSWVGDGCLFVAGSTHPGEEAIILERWARLLKEIPKLYLVIAPRKVERGVEIIELVRKYDLEGFLRTQNVVAHAQVMVLDTLGELSELYGYADLAFVGGSLVDEGGHNPLEPAVYGKAVLFGSYMSDFSEISQELINVGGAEVVTEDSFEAVVGKYFTNPQIRKKMGSLGAQLVSEHQGAATRYVEQIKQLLASSVVH